MNIAVLSDIHGNYIAFKNVIDYLATKNIDVYCILGDYSGEYPGICECLDLIYELQTKYPVYIIRGNKEDYLMWGIGEEHPEWEEYKSTVGMIKYANACLRKKDWDFIKSLPETLSLQFPDKEELLLCHGSPRKIKEQIHQGHQENKEIFEATNAKYIVCGHTHRYMDFEEWGKHIFNPGSVGFSVEEDKQEYANFMILHDEGKEWYAEHIEIKKDLDIIMQDVIQHQLHEIAPYWCLCAEACSRGADITHTPVLLRAMEITRQETGECNWPAIPEENWAKAFKELVIDKYPEIYDKMTLKVS